MTLLKWSGKQVIDFLNLFQNYPCLWDVSSKEYLDRNVKEAAYSELLQNLKDAGMTATAEQVKKKIKSLRDTYRKELSKIKKSQKSDAGASEIYKPKLVWFSNAEVFWHAAVAGRESSSNMEILKLPEDEDENQSSKSDNVLEKRATSIVKPHEIHQPRPRQSACASVLTSTKRSSTTMDPLRSKLLKMQPNEIRNPSRFESAVDKLQSISELASEDTEDEYDKFGQHIAFQLRKLPTRSSILLQSKFQNLITEERLKALNDDNSEPLQ